MLIAALVVDTGMHAMAKRRLQAVADTTALATARYLSGCDGTTDINAAQARSVAAASAKANGYTGDIASEPGAVTLGTVTTGASGVRSFQASAAPEDADSARILVRETKPRSLMMPGWITGSADLQAVAVAQAGTRASFSAGSFLLSADTQDATLLNGLFSGMLGSNINLSAVGYQGLVDANVTLGALLQSAQAAGLVVSGQDVDGLLNAQVTLSQFLTIMAGALGDGSAAQITVNEFAAASVAPLPPFRIGTILRVDNGVGNGPLDVGLNAYSLLAAGIEAANQGNPVSVSANLSAPPLDSATITLDIIEPAQIAAGRPGRNADGTWHTELRTAQARLEIGLHSAVTVLGTLKTQADLHLYMVSAQTDAWLRSINCAGPGQSYNAATIGANPGVVNFGIGGFSDIATAPAGSAPSPPVIVTTLTGTPVASISVSTAMQSAADRADQVSFQVGYDQPLPQAPKAVGTGFGASVSSALGSLAGSLTLTPQLLGLGLPAGVTLDTLSQDVESQVLVPALSAADQAVLRPLLEGLGIHVGGADITLLSLKIQKPRLVW